MRFLAYEKTAAISHADLYAIWSERSMLLRLKKLEWATFKFLSNRESYLILRSIFRHPHDEIADRLLQSLYYDRVFLEWVYKNAISKKISHLYCLHRRVVSLQAEQSYSQTIPLIGCYDGFSPSPLRLILLPVPKLPS